MHRPLIGTGSPATIRLEAFGQRITDATGEIAYHVGSSTRRDVDVRLILPDDRFNALFPGYERHHQIDAWWALLCHALSELAARMTGLPVDFQIQSQSHANAGDAAELAEMLQ
jgi:hypothetical protein